MSTTVPVITIAQQKGGAGKTTLSAHLSVAFTHFGLRVALIDTDPQGSLSEWYKVRCQQFGESVQDTLTLTKAAGWRAANLVDKLKRNADIIIIDSPPRTETETRTGIRHADLVVVPMQPSPMDLWATRTTLEIAEAEKTPTLLVLNRVNANAKLADVIRSRVDSLSKNEIGNRVIFAASLIEGAAVSDIAPYSIAGQEMGALAEEICASVGIELVDEPIHEHTIAARS